MCVSGVVFIYGVTGGLVGRDPNLRVFCFLFFFLMCWKEI